MDSNMIRSRGSPLSWPSIKVREWHVAMASIKWPFSSSIKLLISPWKLIQNKSLKWCTYMCQKPSMINGRWLHCKTKHCLSIFQFSFPLHKLNLMTTFQRNLNQYSVYRCITSQHFLILRKLQISAVDPPNQLSWVTKH